MAKQSVRYQKQLEIRTETGPVECAAAVAKVKEMAQIKVDRTYRNGRKRKGVDQTINLVLSLGIDPKQADQMIRGAISLPKGTGRTSRVIAFCDGPLIEAAKAAGALEAGADELVDKVAKGWSEFDVAVAHPAMMSKVGKLGRVLGPQGKMPSPKSGTVTPDIVTAVREYTAGKLEYRNDAGGNVHLPVGKASFAVEDLKDNIEAFIAHIQRVKPSASKGTYLKAAYLAGAMTPSVRILVGA